MGLLALGTPLQWFESRTYNEHIRDEGIEQLLYIFQAAGKRDNDPLFWGDELEYMVVDFDDKERNSMLDVCHDKILTELNMEDSSLCEANDVSFHPEYGRYMLEATPASPYLNYVGSYVEVNMQKRRAIAEYKLSEYARQDSKNNLHVGSRSVPLTLTVFPRMGCPDFINIKDPWNHKNAASRSLFLPDEVINRHVRFPNLTASIRTRRGEKVCMNVPMYKDIATPETDDSIYDRDWFLPEDKEAKLASKPGFIYMDSMGFGMGCSCLQVTFQAPNINKARYLYDALVNFAPIMLAFSAAAPAFKGWLADQDVRWNVISGAVDDRTPKERGVAPLLPKYNKNGFGGIAKDVQDKVLEIPKSRYSSVDLFLGGSKFFNRTYNDTNVPINEKVLGRLLENDKAPLDYDLAKHFAHLYIRDPVSTFEELLNQDNKTSSNHFENIQSTNWQTLRFKPPTQQATPDKKDSPGWRVEFRPFEVQLLDFENAAYSVLIYLIVDSILTFSDNINAYIHMSKVWENMKIAHHRDAILFEKFHWKKSFRNDTDVETEDYSISEIFHNPENGIFPQFVTPILCQKGFVTKDWKELKHSSKHERLYYYLKLISDRASGELPTTAKFFRNFVLQHPDYKHDSKISKSINYDLLSTCDRLTHLDDSKGELTSFLGAEIAEYVKKNKLSIESKC